MGKEMKLFEKLVSGRSDNNIRFSELKNLLKTLGFEERVKGSHFIYYKDGIEEIINIQSNKGNAKTYQVKQIRNLIKKHKIKLK